MKNVPLLLAAIAACVFAGPLTAEGSKAGCQDVQWRDDRIAKSCVAVVERNGKRYVKLSGAGHFPPTEIPDKVNALIEEFVAAL